MADDSLFDIANTHSVASGEGDLGDKVSDLITKGIPLAMASGVTSILNTGISLGNALGGEDQPTDLGRKLREFDDDLSRYYQEHRTGVDLGGFVITSLVPGTLGMKGLKALQSIKDGEGIGKNVATVAGYFASKEEKYLEAAKAVIRSPRGEVIKSITADKIAGIASGFAEQALQGAAFETGVMLAMNQNPVMNPEDRGYVSQLIYHTFGSPDFVENALLFGAVGGLFSTAKTLGAIKQARATQDLKDFGQLINRETGEIRLAPGTQAAYQYAAAQDAKAAINNLKDLAAIDLAGETFTPRQIELQTQTAKQADDAYKMFVTENLIKKENNDLAQGILNLTDRVQPVVELGGMQVRSDEVVARLLGGAKRIVRINEGLSETVQELAEKFRGLPISPAGDISLAESNLLKDTFNVIKNFGLENPGTVPEGAVSTQFSKLTALQERLKAGERLSIPEVQKTLDKIVGELTGKGVAANEPFTRIIPEVEGRVPVIRHLPFSGGATNTIVNLRTGAITDAAYPVAGDLGKAAIEDGKMRINGRTRDVPKQFDPIENSPTTSSIQFMLAKASEKPITALSVEDLPGLEAGVIRGGTEGIPVTGYTGVNDRLIDILAEVKRVAILDLTNQGKGVDYISRALNVPEEFIRTGQGNPILGGIKDGQAIENHLNPLHAKIVYGSQRDLNQFTTQGTAAVQAAVQVSQSIAQNAAAFILEDNLKNLPNLQGGLTPFTTLTVASRFATSADAQRSTLGMFAMQVGKMKDLIVKKLGQSWLDSIADSRAAVTSSPAELYNYNLIANKARALGDSFVRLSPEYSGIEDQLILIPKRDLLEYLANKPEDLLEATTNKLAELDPSRIVKTPLESPTAKYLLDFQKITSSIAKKQTNGFAAMGKSHSFDPNAFYFPPVDTTLRPYFALIREANPLEAVRPYSYLFAKSKADLTDKANEVRRKFGDTLEIHFKDDIETQKIKEGILDSGLLMNSVKVDSALKNEGLLSEFVPRKDDLIFREQDQYLWNMAKGQTSLGIELKYGQQLAELRFLEDGWNKTYSKFGESVDVAARRAGENPYTQMINTFHNLPSRSRFDAVWGQLNRGVSSAYNTAVDAYRDGFNAATKGTLSAEEANRLASQQGFRAPFGDLAHDIFNETIGDPNALAKLVSKVNLAVGTLMIRMDPLNSLINTMSMPVLLGAESSSTRKQIIAKLGLEEQIPGTTYKIPTTMRIMYAATKSFIQDSKGYVLPDGRRVESLRDYMSEIGVNRTQVQQVFDSAAIQPSGAKSAQGAYAYVENLMKSVGEWGAKYSGNNFAEEYVRYVAGFAGLKFAEAQGITHSGDLAAYMNLFANRVHGNYLASQRPTLFSGPVGQAIGLFQTYQFNMIQQMTRYLQEGDYKAVLIAAGLQNSLFGLQGNPLFGQLNKYVGDSNRNHLDLIGGVAGTVGVPGAGAYDPARWILYGLGANALQTNLYNRGDLTPRYTTIIPTSPQDIPIVSIPAKAIGSFVDSIRAVSNGAPVPEAVLQGISHAGFNRPLAGLASLAAGGKVTNQGTLIAAYSDLDALGIAGLLAGGQPLDVAIAADALNRMQFYKANQRARIAEVGEAVKLTTAGKSGEIDSERIQDFMRAYAATGGDIKNFNKFLVANTKASNQSVINRFKQNMRDPLAQSSLGWLGADLTDYQNQGQPSF